MKQKNVTILFAAILLTAICGVKAEESKKVL